MIWELKIECISGPYIEEDFIRTIEIDSKSSLLDLHDFIQDAVAFNRDHLFEFFVGRNPRSRTLVFEKNFECEASIDIYSETILEQVYPLPKSCKLYYHFDFGDDWYFEIRKSRKKPREPEKGIQYPRIIESIGPAPQQYGDWEDE
jgi:hypothetical protein